MKPGIYLIEVAECAACSGRGYYISNDMEVRHDPCGGRGYIETRTDADAWLLDKLGDVRFGFGTDDGRDCLVDPRWNTNEIEK